MVGLVMEIPAERRADSLILEFLCIFVLIIYVTFVIVFVTHIVDGRLPLTDAFFGADTQRVLGNMVDRHTDYYRLKVHPLFGWICGIYLAIMAITHQSNSIILPPFLAAIGYIYISLFYALLRSLHLSPIRATTFAMFLASTGSFIHFAQVPETHMAAGISVMLAILIAQVPVRTEIGRTWREYCMFAATFSILVSDVMLWITYITDFSVLRAKGLRAFFVEHFRRIPRLASYVLGGLGLILLLYAPEPIFLNNTVGKLLNFKEEASYIGAAPSNLFYSVNSLGVFAGGLGLIGNGAAFLACLALITRLRQDLKFIPIFAAVAVAFHFFYDRSDSFLFSPNYTPAVVLTLAIAAPSLRSWPPIAAACGALALAGYNIIQLQQTFGVLEGMKQLIPLAAT